MLRIDSHRAARGNAAVLFGASILGLALYTQTAFAQDAAANTDEIEEVVVVAHPLSAEGLAQASAILEGDALDRARSENIGSMLERVPGIQNSSYGPGVGRPVIHGLGGPRVRIMEDRIDTLDVSVTSVDHAVSVEPFIADRVEILKGASTLLYGSGAIGGVVDVHTGRIPHQVPDSVTGGVETRFTDNGDRSVVTGKLKGGAGDFAWHLDASFKDSDVYEIPGFAESARFRAQEEAEEEEEEDGEEHHEEEEEVRGKLPGSQFESSSFAGGASVVKDWGFVGVSVSRIESDYGLPGGHGHHEEEGHDEDGDEDDDDHDEEEEEDPFATPVIDLQQTRADFELAVNQPFSGFEYLNVRFGFNDYEHSEIEPDGEVATVFDNKAWESRAELGFASGDWSGAFGVQHMQREFSAIGEEAFVPPVDTRDTGLFLVAERPLGSGTLEAGARVGFVKHEPDAGGNRDFTIYSASVGFVQGLSDALKLSILADVSTRAPVGEELFANGPHLAIGTFEIGDPSLDEEQAFNLSATLNYTSGPVNFVATAYVTRFNDFIYELPTGEEEDELPVFRFFQEDATFYGIDAELNARVANWDNGGADLRLMFDWVDAELDGSGDPDVPRLPPLRFGAGLGFQAGRFSANVDGLFVAEQDNVSADELVTDDYFDLRARASVSWPLSPGEFVLFVEGRNLTDEDQRQHTSFVKDFAPAPGRALEVGARLNF
ncbi:MAG: TonB-dependent receptor [Pseudomonadota bacterium]